MSQHPKKQGANKKERIDIHTPRSTGPNTKPKQPVPQAKDYEEIEY